MLCSKEASPNRRAGCQSTECKKAGVKIQAGELRFGTFVTIQVSITIVCQYTPRSNRPIGAPKLEVEALVTLSCSRLLHNPNRLQGLCNSATDLQFEGVRRRQPAGLPGWL